MGDGNDTWVGYVPKIHGAEIPLYSHELEGSQKGHWDGGDKNFLKQFILIVILENDSQIWSAGLPSNVHSRRHCLAIPAAKDGIRDLRRRAPVGQARARRASPAGSCLKPLRVLRTSLNVVRV